MVTWYHRNRGEQRLLDRPKVCGTVEPEINEWADGLVSAGKARTKSQIVELGLRALRLAAGAGSVAWPGRKWRPRNGHKRVQISATVPYDLAQWGEDVVWKSRLATWSALLDEALLAAKRELEAV